MRPREITLRLLATTDMHMHLAGWDYTRQVPATGLANLVKTVAAERAESDLSLLLDNGDFLQGTLLADWHVSRWRAGETEINPAIAAMNALGYDAATLGNHEFDYGLDYLADVLRDAEFPFVASNVHLNGTAIPALPIAPWLMLKRTVADMGSTPVKIGLLGVLPPQTASWNQRILEKTAHISDVVESAEKAVEALQNAGADVVVALCHSGIVEPDHRLISENAAIHVAALEGIDAVFAGHTHLVFPGPDHAEIKAADHEHGVLFETPVVMPGCWGSHLGKIDLTLQLSENRWEVTGHKTGLLKVPASHEPMEKRNSRLPKDVSRAHACAIAWGDEILVQSHTALSSHFAPLGTGANEAMIAEAMKHAVINSRLGEAIEADPLLVAVTPFHCGGRAGPEAFVDCKPGPVTRADATALFPFPNELVGLRMRGDEVRDWLDHAAALYSHVPPGLEDTALLGANWIAHHFDALIGLQYLIDLAVAPCAPDAKGPSRITNLSFNGKMVQPNDTFVLITNDFRLNGGGSYPVSNRRDGVLRFGIPAQQALEDFLLETGEFKPAASESAFAFAPVKGSSVVYPTGPGAAEHVGVVGHLDLSKADEATDGFVTYRFSLDS